MLNLNPITEQEKLEVLEEENQQKEILNKKLHKRKKIINKKYLQVECGYSIIRENYNPNKEYVMEER